MIIYLILRTYEQTNDLLKYLLKKKKIMKIYQIF